jgi:hypothetical protein
LVCLFRGRKKAAGEQQESLDKQNKRRTHMKLLTSIADLNLETWLKENGGRQKKHWKLMGL